INQGITMTQARGRSPQGSGTLGSLETGTLTAGYHTQPDPRVSFGLERVGLTDGSVDLNVPVPPPEPTKQTTKKEPDKEEPDIKAHVGQVGLSSMQLTDRGDGHNMLGLDGLMGGGVDLVSGRGHTQINRVGIN